MMESNSHPSSSPAGELSISTIRVQIPGREPHDILVGQGILDELPRRITSLGLARDILIISSPKIYALHGRGLRSALERGGCRRIVEALFPDGEEHKNLETWQTLIAQVHDVEDKFATRVLIVDLGGGVVMDVGGYVAATYDRGRDYIQLPTTLLGDVDCGIGGKTGLNYRGKNKIGSFYQPKLVLADLDFLKTLPPREIRSGLAEVIKYGVILDKEFFAYVESHVGEAVRLQMDTIWRIVRRSFELKTQIVELDERDVKGDRAKLNFGHTIGHALEAATDYSRYAHGEAVAIGMLCACEIAQRLGMFADAETSRVESLCQTVGLPTHMQDVSVDAVMRHMQHDKKFVTGKNRFVLPTKIGEGVLKESIDEDLIRSVVRGRTTSA